MACATTSNPRAPRVERPRAAFMASPRLCASLPKPTDLACVRTGVAATAPVIGRGVVTAAPVISKGLATASCMVSQANEVTSLEKRVKELERQLSECRVSRKAEQQRTEAATKRAAELQELLAERSRRL